MNLYVLLESQYCSLELGDAQQIGMVIIAGYWSSNIEEMQHVNSSNNFIPLSETTYSFTC
jgi:hypothetical protein